MLALSSEILLTSFRKFSLRGSSQKILLATFIYHTLILVIEEAENVTTSQVYTEKSILY